MEARGNNFGGPGGPDERFSGKAKPAGPMPDWDAIPLKLSDWLKRDLAKPDFLLSELLSTTSRILLVGPTGLGKTNFGLGLAHACAAGIPWMHWQPVRPCRVLYIDGEMPRRLLLQRLRDVVRRGGGAEPDTLCTLSREDVENMQPLNTQKGQDQIDSLIAAKGPFDLIIFDNIQALLVGDMKEEEQWAKVLPWVRSLTRRMIGQVWLHHTGHDETKSYGSKAREWQMDTVGLMERVPDADKDADIVLQLTFGKARERTPDNRRDFAPVTLTLKYDQWTWHIDEEAQQPTGQARQALDLLYRAILDAGRIPPASSNIPPNVKAVPVDLWRDYCRKGTAVSVSKDPETHGKAFRRAISALQNARQIGIWDDWVWPVRKPKGG